MVTPWSSQCECDRTMREAPAHSPSAEAFDRGPAKYFHGREKVLANFRDILWRSKQSDGGTVFLIQGAPGAGKTALLCECEKLAQKSEWETTEISSAALWNPDELQRALKPKKNFKVKGGSAGVNILGVGHAEVTAGMLSQTTETLLQEGADALLLTLDEAQILGMKDEFPADQINTVRHVLNAIHNGKLGRPVILIAAGLGPTTKAFGTLGISRFAKRCRVELGALGKEAERAVLHDWLTEDGKATGDTTAWIDAIAKETHGWPQHILSYVEPVLDQLHADKRAMTAEGLATVLETGRVGRTAYYKQRAEGFYREQLHCIARSIADIPAGSHVDHTVIMSSLLQDYSHDEAERIFRQALHKGILDERDNCFIVPIPSMHDWLVSNYARIQVKELSARP